MPLLAAETGQFHTSYKQDVRVYETRNKLVAVLVIAGLAYVAAPSLLSDYWLSVLTLIGIASIATLGLNVLIGYTGLISIGHAAFAAVGGYTAGNVVTQLGWSLLVALPIAGLVAGLCSLVVGLASLRVKGLYLAIATLAAQQLVGWVIIHWSWLSGGGQGVLVIPPVTYGPLSTGTIQGKYIVVAVLLGLGLLFCENLIRTRPGRALIAIRDQDIAASGFGIPVFAYKLLSFFIASFFAGVAGALYGMNLGIVTSEIFSLQLSIQFLAMVLIGGLGSVPGSVLGAAFVTFVPIALQRWVPLLGLDLSATLQIYLENIVYGAAVLGFLILEPLGLYGLYRNARDYFRMWPYSY
jgi:branched-chain amino acid transport system permease protein